MGEEQTRLSELAIARAVAGAVQQVPGVAGISPGRFAEAATYGPGARVRGVVVRWGANGLEVAVHLRVVYGPALVLTALADQARRAARQAIADLEAGPIRRIDIAIDDLLVTEGST